MSNMNKMPENLTSFLRRNKKNLRFYYLMARDRMGSEINATKTLNKILKSVVNDPSFLEMYESFQNARYEFQRIKGIPNRRLRRVLESIIKNPLALQRNLIGGYVKHRLTLTRKEFNRIFKNLSYVNLEMISRKRSRILNIKQRADRSRGDINYLKRESNQYFWSFNEEFWLDELGDYVFSLKSQC